MEAAPKKELGLFDSTCVIVGIVIGAEIYETAPTVASCMGSWWGTLVIWIAGGLLALARALCYAELATAYPREEGDYVYLSRIYVTVSLGGTMATDEDDKDSLVKAVDRCLYESKSHGRNRVTLRASSSAMSEPLPA